jgi:antitoxin PrlF
VIAKVGPKGQIVIPKELRDELGIRPGSAVSLRWSAQDGAVELRKAWNDPIEDIPKYIQAAIPPERVRGSGTETLLAMRREDQEIEERQLARWLGKHSS